MSELCGGHGLDCIMSIFHIPDFRFQIPYFRFHIPYFQRTEAGSWASVTGGDVFI